MRVPKTLSKELGYNAKEQTIRRNGTSTATPIAAGIAALFVDYAWQFMDTDDAWDYENMRKLFIRMSKATIEKDYRYLAPWSLFGLGVDSRTEIKKILLAPVSMSSREWVC